MISFNIAGLEFKQEDGKDNLSQRIIVDRLLLQRGHCPRLKSGSGGLTCVRDRGLSRSG